MFGWTQTDMVAVSGDLPLAASGAPPHFQPGQFSQPPPNFVQQAGADPQAVAAAALYGQQQGPPRTGGGGGGGGGQQPRSEFALSSYCWVTTASTFLVCC